MRVPAWRRKGAWWPSRSSKPRCPRISGRRVRFPSASAIRPAECRSHGSRWGTASRRPPHRRPHGVRRGGRGERPRGRRHRLLREAARRRRRYGPRRHERFETSEAAGESEEPVAGAGRHRSRAGHGEGLRRRGGHPPPRRAVAEVVQPHGTEEETVLPVGDGWARLRAKVTDPRGRDPADWLIGTGVRWGEATAVQVRGTNPRPGAVSVRRAWRKSRKPGRHLGPPKTKKARRVVPPSPARGGRRGVRRPARSRRRRSSGRRTATAGTTAPPQPGMDPGAGPGGRQGPDRAPPRPRPAAHPGLVADRPPDSTAGGPAVAGARFRPDHGGPLRASGAGAGRRRCRCWGVRRKHRVPGRPLVCGRGSGCDRGSLQGDPDARTRTH